MLTKPHTISLHKEETFVSFQVKDFSFIFATQSKECGPTLDPHLVEELSVNCISSDSVLRAGSYAFKISVGWSLGRDMSVQPHSMLGLAVERVDDHTDVIAATFELKLLNRNPAKTVCMATDAPLAICEHGLKGWFPAPYADRRESADGFVLLKEVLDSTKGWLDNDTLSVECRMTVAITAPEPREEAEEARGAGLHDLASQFGNLLESGEGVDVTIRTGDEIIRAHSLILSVRSPVFRAMLSHSMREQAEKEVSIPDLDPTGVRRMVAFMYKGKLDSELGDDDATVSLLEAAHRYQVGALVELCVSALSTKLSVEHVAERLMLADFAGIDLLRQRCLAFITSSPANLQAVQTTEAFAQLSRKRPHLAVDILAAAFPPAKHQRSR